MIRLWIHSTLMWFRLWTLIIIFVSRHRSVHHFNPTYLAAGAHPVIKRCSTERQPVRHIDVLGGYPLGHWVRVSMMPLPDDTEM